MRLLALSALLLIAVCVHARAGDAAPTVYPQSLTCDQVRSFVAVHGRWKALAWAVEQGATVGQIAAARRCLNAASPVSADRK